jgi:hypothetical protein
LRIRIVRGGGDVRTIISARLIMKTTQRGLKCADDILCTKLMVRARAGGGGSIFQDGFKGAAVDAKSHTTWGGREPRLIALKISPKQQNKEMLQKRGRFEKTFRSADSATNSPRRVGVRWQNLTENQKFGFFSDLGNPPNPNPTDSGQCDVNIIYGHSL